MITILNDDLFSFEHKTGSDRHSGTKVSRLVVSTSNKLVRYSREKTKNDKGVDMSSTPQLVSTSREILSITTPIDKENDWNKLPISVSVMDNERRIPQINIRCLGEDEKRRNANIYVLAIPFNGMIVPIPEDPTYRIYKGMIGSSQRPIYVHGRRYRKVLYLVIEPNMALLDPEHKHHVREISVKVESFAVYKDNELGEDRTNHETYTFKVIDADGMYTEDMQQETLEEAVMIEHDQSVELWHTFRFTRNQKDGTQPNPSRRSPSKAKSQPEGYVQGNVLITKNKHGIRKEVSLDNRGRPRPQKDLEAMMKDSGMYDQDGYNSDRKGGRNKNGKKGKRGRR
ncbi:MAG: hypothetical protein NC548_05925 [Lachnospiraceae bacterium]|nr:hypothetical protein [Lachnospiraceae bacterium]